MRYISITALGIAALMLAGAPAPTRAGSTSDTPSATENMDKAEGLGGKVKSTAKEARSDATDAWVTAKAKIGCRDLSRQVVKPDRWNKGKILYFKCLG